MELAMTDSITSRQNNIKIHEIGILGVCVQAYRNKAIFDPSVFKN